MRDPRTGSTDPAHGDLMNRARSLDPVAQRLQVAIDCQDPERLAEFWASVLDYQVGEPPVGYASWTEHALDQAEEPGEFWIKIQDPDRLGPTLLFHRVPEPKTVKNRIHLDVKAPASSADDRGDQVQAFIERIVNWGGTKVRDVTDDAGYFAVMNDPEGNEFCVG